jgi:hypothetical protein
MNCLNEEIKALRAELLEMARAHAAERDRAEGEHVAALEALAAPLIKSGYGQYLLGVLRERVF